MISVPEFLQAQRHAHRFEAHPLASVDKRIGAKRTTKIAPLRGYEVELTLALQFKVALDRNESVVMRAKFIDLLQRSVRIFVHAAIRESDGAALAAQQGLPILEAPHDFGEGFLALASNRHVD